MAHETLEDLEDNIWYRPKFYKNYRNAAGKNGRYRRNIANPSVLLYIHIKLSIKL